MNKEREVYELIITDEEDMLHGISVVGEPAIERNFVAMSKPKPKPTVHLASEEKMEIVGPAMVPDMMIYRRDKDGEEYDVFFTADTIKQLSYMYLSNAKYSVNLNHEGDPVEGVKIVESWIKEDENDKSTAYGFSDLPVGTWFVKFKVNDPEIWAKVKSKELNGFSIEAVMTMEKRKRNQLMSKLMGLYREVRKALGFRTFDELQGTHTLADGTSIVIREDRAFQSGLDGEMGEQLPEGTYTLADGSKLSIGQNGETIGFEQAPVEEIPVEEAPVEDMPTEPAPSDTPAEEAPETPEPESPEPDEVVYPDGISNTEEGNYVVSRDGRMLAVMTPEDFAWMLEQLGVTEMKSELEAKDKEIEKLSKMPIATPSPLPNLAKNDMDDRLQNLLRVAKRK